MDVKCSTDTESNQSNAVCDLLHHGSGASQRWRCDPLTAPFVHDETEREVGSGDQSHAPFDGLTVVSGVPHLGHDRKESRCSSARAEDGGGSSDTRGERWVGDDMVAEIEFSCLRGRSGAIESGDTDTIALLVSFKYTLMTDEDLHNNEHSHEDGDETSPGNPCDLLKLAYTCADTDHKRCDDGEVVRAKRMVRECVKCCGYTDHSGGTNNDECHQEQSTGDFLDDSTTD